jgi:hypothetical protein
MLKAGEVFEIMKLAHDVPPSVERGQIAAAPWYQRHRHLQTRSNMRLSIAP